MKICIFEPPSKKLLYFLGYIVLAYIRELFEYQLNDIFKRKEAQFFEFAFFYTIGDLICGLFVLIINKRTDSIKIDENETSKNDLKYTSSMKKSLIFNDSQSDLKYLSLKRVLYLSIYDLLAQSCIVIYFFIYSKDGTKVEYNNLNLTLIVDITSRFILHKIRLGMKFYSHFYLSITLNILSFIILSISDIYFLNNSNGHQNWMYLGFTIISTILYSFENVEGKIGLNIEFLNVYSLIFYKGIIQSIFLIIIAIIFLVLKKYYLFTAFFDNDENIFFTIAIIFLYLMLNLFTNICIWKIIDIYSIQHLTIAKGGSSFIFYISSLIKGKGINYPNNNNILYFTDIFGFILLFISTLIHNEIIILNCCGLSTHTHKKLLEREKTDLQMTKNNESSLDSSYETKDINESGKKNDETQSYKETFKTISELSENFLPED